LPGGHAHRHEGGVKKAKALVEEQDVQVGTGARVPRLGPVQKPCKGETVATDGRDGLNDRSRWRGTAGYGCHQIMQCRCPVVLVRVEVLGKDLGPYGVTRHYRKGFGKADALVR